MKQRVIRLAVCLMPWLALAATSDSLADTQECFKSARPAATLPGQPAAVFCDDLRHGPGTAKSRNNSWFDSFDHGLSMGDFKATRYRVFESVDGIYRSRHWRAADNVLSNEWAGIYSIVVR